MDKYDKKLKNKLIRDIDNIKRKHRLKIKKYDIEDINNIIIIETVNKKQTTKEKEKLRNIMLLRLLVLIIQK